MKKRDRAIVAVILAAALIGGLVLVHRALNRAAQAQTDRLAAAQFNGVSGAQESPGQTGVQTPSAGETVPPQTTPPDGDTQTGGQVPSGGDAETPGQAGEAGQPPSAGGGAMTLAELTAWMENESSGALAAQSMLEAEQALAAGVGTADDALRRTFAQSQAQANDEARRNQLSEQAAALGYDYLRCRDLLALREESTAFWQALEAAVTAQAGTDAGQEEVRQADLQTVQAALVSAQLALEEARADLQEAEDALNAALGNPYGTALEVTDALEAEPMPSLTGDEAAAQALEARNEVKGAAYQVQRAEQTLTQLRYQYAPDSPEVLEQQAALQTAQADSAAALTQVEADVRDRLTRLGIQAQKLEQLSAALAQTGTAPPEAAYALTDGGAGTWSSNLSQLTARWAEVEGSRAQLTAAVAQFNLDVLCFTHAVGVGCTAAAI